MKIRDKIEGMNNLAKGTFLKIQENAKAQLQSEEEHLQELEKTIDEKSALYDKLKVGFDSMGEDVTGEHKENYDKLHKEIVDLQKEYSMSQEIIQFIKHNFEL